MSSAHHHGHTHAGHGRQAAQKRLAIVLVLSGLYMIAEIIGGFLTHSLALLADAGHMFSDVAALALSLAAMWIAQRPPTPKHSYGYYRAEILAGLINGATLVAVSIYIFWEAIQRFREPRQVEGATMMWIAVGGLAVNIAGLWLLHSGRAESLNIRAAWLHVFGDMLGSLGTIVAGALILLFGWNWADPAISIVIGLLVIRASWALLKETVNVLMEGVPHGIDVDEVRDALAGISGVRAVHDLHIWSITSGLDALSAHVVARDREYPGLLQEIRQMLHNRFEIDHSTVQIEPEEFGEQRPAF
ncbi:cation diffusion facilitator family transporter [Verrucomicrobiota bacterium sgz303538]